MIVLRILPVLALAVSLVGANASVGDAARVAKPKKPRISFSASVRLLDANSGRLSVKGLLRLNGRKVPATIRFRAVTRDSFGAACGPAQGGRQSGFTLRFAHADSVDVTVTAIAKIAGKRVRANRTRHLKLDGQVGMNCLTSSSGDVPPPLHGDGTNQVCAYAFSADPANNPKGVRCGVPMDDHNHPLPPSAAVPYWVNHPVVRRQTDGTVAVSVPPFASPYGPCVQKQIGDVGDTWLAGPVVQKHEFDCPSGVYIVATWYLYFAPNDRSDLSVHPYASCKAGDFGQVGFPPGIGVLPAGGNMTRFLLPSGWLGRVDLEVLMLAYRGNHSLSDTFVDSEYTDYSFYPSPNGYGSVDPCPLIEAWRPTS